MLDSIRLALVLSGPPLAMTIVSWLMPGGNSIHVVTKRGNVVLGDRPAAYGDIGNYNFHASLRAIQQWEGNSAMISGFVFFRI